MNTLVGDSEHNDYYTQYCIIFVGIQALVLISLLVDNDKIVVVLLFLPTTGTTMEYHYEYCKH